MQADVDIERLVTFVVTSLVDNPDDVQVQTTRNGRDLLIELTLHADDIGKVIGRQGRVIKAIRTVARAAGSVDGTQVDVEVLG